MEIIIKKKKTTLIYIEVKIENQCIIDVYINII